MDTSILIGIIALAVSLITAFFTGYGVALSRKGLYSQIDPRVVVFSHHDFSRTTILQIIIRNIGSTPAYNVHFKLNCAVPAKAFGFEGDNLEVIKPMSDGPLIEGIPFLAPGEERIIDWGQMGGLKRNLTQEIISVTASYTNEGGKRLEYKSLLEIKSFSTTTASVSNPYKGIEQELSKLNQSVSKLAK